MFTGFKFHDGPSPLKPWRPSFPTYAISRVMFWVNWRWMETFHAPIAGSTWLVGRILGCTLPAGPPKGRIPLGGTTGNTLAVGPTDRLNAEMKLSEAPGMLVDAVICWFAKTGRFWVTACPKFDPNTPMS